ncbi:MAG: hypothetical protein HYV26_02105 [Candidatus Hydrogenedentes bacterium]|nr:hypothetical protein [Candidatus Hydrogenedentota bacterium]
MLRYLLSLSITACVLFPSPATADDEDNALRFNNVLYPGSLQAAPASVVRIPLFLERNGTLPDLASNITAGLEYDEGVLTPVLTTGATVQVIPGPLLDLW